MKWINNFEPLEIKQVNDKDIEIKNQRILNDKKEF